MTWTLLTTATATTPRRRLLALAATALLGACASPGGPGSAAAPERPPIVFVHGNGDSAALWQVQQWRFESNGWPRDRLHAVHFPHPQARDDNAVPQMGRSGTDEQRAYLASEVAKVLAATGAKQVVLYGNSRGGNAIRDCIATPADQGGCGGRVSHAILGGTPNHGVWAIPSLRPGNEFNGSGAFLTGLNAPKGPEGLEVTPGVKWLTLRSDNNDKFAQPDGVWIGAKGTPTNVTAEGPALKGATNLVLPGRDHREVSYHAQAFEQAWRFITGTAPATLQVTPEPVVVLDGQVNGFTTGGPTNQPLPGATLAVWAVDATTGERRGTALLTRTIGADGRWGPLTTDTRTALEFELSAPGFATSHLYRAPFPRSTALLHLRPERLTDAEVAAGAVVTMTRPRGYFGVPRDTVLLDGQPAPGIPPGVAGVASSKLVLTDGRSRPVVADYTSGTVQQRLVGRTWPAKDRQLTVLELTD
jgi:pimeloyl-ACP methyl ester carboxylesterase